MTNKNITLTNGYVSITFNRDTKYVVNTYIKPGYNNGGAPMIGTGGMTIRFVGFGGGPEYYKYEDILRDPQFYIE